MRPYRIRPDLERTVIGGFALPLGFLPDDASLVAAPTPGYTVAFTPGEDDEPDSSSIYAVTSHERVPALVDRFLGLLSDDVYGILEIGSRDAYRSVDVFMAPEPISQEEFRKGWQQYESFILEDVSVGCGANGDDPFVEIFLDQRKGLSVHVPPSMLDEVERLLAEFGLEQVPETWPENDEALGPRPVLAGESEVAPGGLDDLLLDLRHAWRLELNIDPETNVDEAGRALGHTLWHAMVIVDSTHDDVTTAYASIWATAGSLREMESLIDTAIVKTSDWTFAEIDTIDRVAFDDRPESLSDLEPRRTKAEIHHAGFDP